jgi:Cytochrome bd terminal oxidase subunit II
MNHLIPFWFILWTGFFVLEGFDFGVGMLHGVVSEDEAGHRAAINTIGPLWDGNEVRLIVAGDAMFAAFPGWYATMFSGLYLALVLLLASLTVRGVAFEYRGTRDAARWRRTWEVLLTTGSLLAHFGHDEYAPIAPGMKTIEDAMKIRRRVFGAFEMTESADDPAERARWLTFALVGGGPTGVELAGQIREVATKTLRREYRRIRPEDARVLLFDGGSAPLAAR